jgi:hypothetical protein
MSKRPLSARISPWKRLKLEIHEKIKKKLASGKKFML